ADHMADLGFLPGVTRILAATPARGQRLLFSATLDRGIDALAKRFLHNPVSHEVDEASVPVGEMTHRVLVAADADAKKRLVEDLASGVGRRILFTRTKHHAKKLAKQLTSAGIPSVDLHGNLGQNARERNLAACSADSADGGVRVLVATDVAACGVHVDDVELVVHVDPPVEHKAYLHRSGRTARAGAAGTVVTLALPEQRRDVKDILRKAQISVGLEDVTPAIVSELVGERAPKVKYVPAPTQPQGKPKAKSGQGRGNAQAAGRGRGGRGRGQGAQGQSSTRDQAQPRQRSGSQGQSRRPAAVYSTSTGAAAPAQGRQRSTGSRRASRPQGS